jgi:hypothetical protein
VLRYIIYLFGLKVTNYLRNKIKYFFSIIYIAILKEYSLLRREPEVMKIMSRKKKYNGKKLANA